jgi:uncharacterized protein DUF1902
MGRRPQPIDPTAVEGASDSPYVTGIGHHRVDLHTVDPGVPVLWWRSGQDTKGSRERSVCVSSGATGYTNCVMATNTYHVQADWDPEVGVWVVTSEDVPGPSSSIAVFGLMS